MMKTFFLLPMPPISVRIWLMARSEAPPASPLETKILDSRKNIYIESIHGPAAAEGLGNGGELIEEEDARQTNTSRTLASDSLNHMAMCSLKSRQK